MSLAHRRPGAPHSLRIPATPATMAVGSATLPSRRLARPATTPRLANMYGLDSSFFEHTPTPTLKRRPKPTPPIENHEKPHPRILVGREPSWAPLYASTSLWSVHLLDHLEQTYPLQPVIALTPRRQVLRGWEAHIGAFDISNPARLTGKGWLFPCVAQRWWAENYKEQLGRRFPREDIVFLLHRAEDVIAALEIGGEELRTLKESLYWLMAERTPSVCSSVASTHTFPTSLASNPAASPVAEKYTRSVLQSQQARITAVRHAMSALHRLPPLLAVIRALLQYLRARARSESAGIAARERERTSTPADVEVLTALEEIECWHVAPELRLEELERLASEWFERGDRGMRELGKLAGLVEGRLRG